MRNLRVQTEKDFVQRDSKRTANLEHARIFSAMKEITQKRVINQCLEMPQFGSEVQPYLDPNWLRL